MNYDFILLNWWTVFNAKLMLFAGWFHYHKASPKLASTSGCKGGGKNIPILLVAQP